MRGDIGFVYLGDVAMHRDIREILLIEFAEAWLQFGSEDALVAEAGECKVEAAESSEEVNEA